MLDSGVFSEEVLRQLISGIRVGLYLDKGDALLVCYPTLTELRCQLRRAAVLDNCSPALRVFTEASKGNAR